MSPLSRNARSTLPRWLEFLAAPAIRCLYRIKSRGAEAIPAGGVLLAANHLSYADAMVLQMACPRPIRFVGYESLRDSHGFFRFAFHFGGVLPLARERPLHGFRSILTCLRRGECVCLFVEGAISRTGQLMRLQRGVELLAQRAGVPVVPVAHDGLWGSVFSFSDNKYLFKPPRIMRTHVAVEWGAAVPATEVTLERLRTALLDLGERAFQERPQLKRHLGREIVRGLARRPWRVEMIDRTAERKEVKAAQLLAVAAAFSRHLIRTVPEPRVGIVLPPGAGASIANLAVLCAGKVPVNLNFTAGRAAIEASLRQGGVKTVISAHALKEKVKDFPFEMVRFLDFRSEVAAMGGKKAIIPWLLGAWVLPNQWIANLLGLPKHGDQTEAGLLFTSGSAGEPKGVPLTHRNILSNCWQVSSLCVLGENARMLACLPVFHSFGFTVTCWYPMMRGCQVVTVPSPLDTRRIIDAIREEKVNVMVGAPTFLRPLVKKADPTDLQTIDLLVSGAEKMPMDLYEEVLQKFGIETMQGYGLTETTPVANVNQPDPQQVLTTSEPQAGKRLGSVGRLLPGLTARVLDPETMAEVSPLTQGLIALRGGNVFGGYLDNPTKNAEAFHEGWFVTGDLGRFDEDGFLYIEGRLSRFSKIGGEMVPHGTIEQHVVDAYDLTSSEGYAAVVMGVPDRNKGELLVLLTTVDLAGDDLRDKLTERGLPNLWVPRVVHRVETIPVLGTGKLDLRQCMELALAAAGG